MQHRSIALDSIRIDGGTQPRARIDEAVVAEYAQAMCDGAEFPSVIVFHDGVDTWLADGFHRFHAARKIEAAAIKACVFTGTKRDAILHSVGANAAHGARRTNDDKRRAVAILIGDTEWAAWSDREIARRCAVHHELVAKQRPNRILAVTASMNSERTFTHHKTGAPTTMRTENIGRRDSVAAERVPTQPTARKSEPPRSPQSRGIGLAYAHKAISFLQEIPPDDGLRDEALDTVVRWITDNR
jgi:hypothetical protein